MYVYNAVVVKVVDGDTIDCNIDLGFHTWVCKRVRLLGIDTPELNSTDQAQREAAKEAKEELIENLEGREIILETKLDRSDKYGRVLGAIYFELEDAGDFEKSYNSILIDQGFAVKYEGK